MLLPLDNQRNDIEKLLPERQIQRQLLAHEVCLVGQGLLISGGDSGRRRGVFVLLRNVFSRDSILARTAELLATLRSFRGSTAPPQNLNRDFATGPTAYRSAVYCAGVLQTRKFRGSCSSLHRRIVVARCSIHSLLQLLALGGFAAQKQQLNCFCLLQPS